MSTSLRAVVVVAAPAAEGALEAATTAAAASLVAVSPAWLDTADAARSCSAPASDDEDDETADEEGSITTNCTCCG